VVSSRLSVNPRGTEHSSRSMEQRSPDGSPASVHLRAGVREILLAQETRAILGTRGDEGSAVVPVD
jgi:hypothetical protein